MTPDDANQPADGDDDLDDETVARMLIAGTGAAESRDGWTPPPPEDIERLLPEYAVHKMTGRGGMGAVYRGVQRSLDRVVAIKILPPEIARSDPRFAARFEQEARAMARLPHPHIVSVYDFGKATRWVEDGSSHSEAGVNASFLYIVMEFIDGTDVGRIMQKEGRLPAARAAAIVMEICDALEFAHHHGIIHRDIKPSNVMLDQRGQVKVTDFGLVKELSSRNRPTTAPGMVMGTRAYMAPEQARGLPVDHRADIYSLGAMFYEMLTGEPPLGAFEAPSHRCPVDARLDAVILKALAQDPARRYQHVSAMKTDVDRIAGEADSIVSPTPSRVKSGGLWMVAVLIVIGGFLLSRHTPVGSQSINDVSRKSAQEALGRGARVIVRNATGRDCLVNPGEPLPEGRISLLAIKFEVPASMPLVLPPGEVIRLCRPPEIEVLSFFNCVPDLSDATFAAFGSLPRLRELDFNNPRMQDGWLRHLAANTTLMVLRIPGSSISDSGLAHLAGIPCLDDLDFNRSRVTGRGIAALASAPTLRGLCFGGPDHRLTSDDLAAVADHCGQLDKLVLSAPVSPEDLRVLTRLKKLRVIMFDCGEPLGSAHFRALEGTSITQINIIHADVADDAWEALAALPRVATVQFTNMRFPDIAALAFSRMPSLRKVVLADCSAAEAVRAQAALPNVAVQKIGVDKSIPAGPPRRTN